MVFFVFFSGPNVQGWASGWGVIDPNNKAVQAKKLQKIDVYTMPQRECEDYYDNDGSVTDTMMCAKSYKGMKEKSSSSDEFRIIMYCLWASEGIKYSKQE